MQAAFRSPGAFGEDIEDELGPVDHLDANAGFEVALLGWSQVVVENQHVGLGGLGKLLEFDDFAVTDQCGCVDGRTGLETLGNSVHPRAARELTKLGKGFGRRSGQGSLAAFESGQYCLFRCLGEIYRVGNPEGSDRVRIMMPRRNRRAATAGRGPNGLRGRREPRVRGAPRLRLAQVLEPAARGWPDTW